VDETDSFSPFVPVVHLIRKATTTKGRPDFLFAVFVDTSKEIFRFEGYRHFLDFTKIKLATRLMTAAPRDAEIILVHFASAL
jgi:hypothetical protein